MPDKEDKSGVTMSGINTIPLLSVIIPVYNEDIYIGKVIEKVLSLDRNIEIVAVNDGSADNTGRILDRFSELYPDRVKVIHSPANRGKGSAIRTGIGHVRGEVVIIQDADLEYDPEDILKVIKPIMDGRASVVYGSRVLAQNPRFKNSYYWGGRFLSVATNLLYGTDITDEPTCYKAFKADILKGLDLKCTGFEFCPEVTAKVARAGHKIMEVPVSYNPRSFEEGKKIRLKDGLMALYTLLKYRFFK